MTTFPEGGSFSLSRTYFRPERGSWVVIELLRRNVRGRREGLRSEGPSSGERERETPGLKLFPPVYPGTRKSISTASRITRACEALNHIRARGCSLAGRLFEGKIVLKILVWRERMGGGACNGKEKGPPQFVVVWTTRSDERRVYIGSPARWTGEK